MHEWVAILTFLLTHVFRVEPLRLEREDWKNQGKFILLQKTISGALFGAQCFVCLVGWLIGLLFFSGPDKS